MTAVSASPLARLFLIVAAALLLLGTATFAHAAYEPPRGSKERKDLMNAIRPLIETRVGAPVEFVVNRLRVSGPWAFAIVSPQRPGGRPIDLSRTLMRDRAEYMDGGLRTYVLLTKAYNRWNIVDYAIGPTDVFWYGDPLYSQLPAGLVPQ
ncbi:hypothetical protein [Stappia indica]|uniref:hypothetical protein n=1 Tax=Stappia indica TaxID=538381 RepID=UPI001CD5A554|nr:hypothetical protein [Stappia indica]MCA1299964.1 hypothetical protein [Stappia indica]